MSKVSIVRLCSGEDLICKVEETKEGYLLRDIGLIIPVGNGEIGLAPWMPYSDTKNGVTISRSFVGFVVAAESNLAEQYTNGFVPRTQGLIVPEREKLKVPSLKLSD